MFENELEQLKISDFIVDKISCAGAMKAILASHYMHRKTPCMYAYGLYYSIEALGVISFGLPASPSLVKGICGEEEKEHVIELNRLWIRDGTPKNSESFLIGQALKMLPKKYSIVVSYADTKENHTGIVYQATNFLYTGLSANVFNYQLAGEENKHSRGFLQRYGGTVESAKKILGEDKILKVPRSRKHRYIIFRGSKTEKKRLRKLLRYEVQAYPKAD